MASPWERYGAQAPTADVPAAATGPWAKYGGAPASFDERFSAAPPVAPAAPVTGPAGENPAYQAAVAQTPTGSMISGPTFAGRGLPGGTPGQKGMALGGAVAGGALGPLISAIAGGGGAAAGGSTAAMLARQGVAPDIIELLAGEGAKKAPGTVSKLVRMGVTGGATMGAMKGMEALGVPSEYAHDFGLPILFNIFGKH